MIGDYYFPVQKKYEYTKKVPSTDNSQRFKSEKDLLAREVAQFSLISLSGIDPDLHHSAKIVISGHAFNLIMPCYNTTVS